MADKIGKAHVQKHLDSDVLRQDEKLSHTHADAAAGAGLVRVRVDGHRVLRSLVIDREAFEGRDPSLLADLIMSAIAEAQRRVDDFGEELSASPRESDPSDG